MDTGPIKPPSGATSTSSSDSPSLNTPQGSCKSKAVRPGPLITHRKTELSSTEATSAQSEKSDQVYENLKKRLDTVTNQYIAIEKPSLTAFRKMNADNYMMLLSDTSLQIMLDSVSEDDFRKYSSKALRLMADEIKGIKGRSAEERINNCVARHVLACWQKQSLVESVWQELVSFPTDNLDISLQAVEVYLKLANSTKTIKSHEQLENAVRLALDSQFSPLVVLLIRMLCRPESKSGVNQGYMLDLLACCNDRQTVLGVAQPMGKVQEDLALILGEPDGIDQSSSSMHFAWLLLAIVLDERRPSVSGSPFSEKIYVHLETVLRLTLTGYKAGSLDKLRAVYKKAVHSAPREKRYQVKSAFKESSLVRIGEVLDNQREGQTVYVQGVIDLVLGHYYKYQYLLNKDMDLKAAHHFCRAAAGGQFPLLYLEATHIYMARADYNKASECLVAALKIPTIPKSLTATIKNLCDICAQKLLEAEISRQQLLIELTSEEGANPEQSKKSHRKQKKKNRAQRTPDTALTQPQPQPQSQSGSATIDTGSSKETTGSSTLISDASVGSLLVKPASEDEGRATGSTSAGIDSAAELSVGAMTLDQTDGWLHGWLPDQDSKVARMIRTVNKHREEDDTKNEFKYLDNLLAKGDERLYGRIQEEKGWSFLRMADYPRFPLGTPRVERKKALMEWLIQAEDCFNEAAAAYMKTSSFDKMTPDKLLGIIESQYSLDPLLRNNLEYRKRMRALCSSFGHLHSHKARIASENARIKLGGMATEFYNLKIKVDPDYIPAIGAEP